MSDIEQRLRAGPEVRVIEDGSGAWEMDPDTTGEIMREAADEITRLEADNASLRSKLEEAEGALKAAREFIADEFNDDRYEESGEWLPPEARDVHKQLCEAEVALSALREADHA